MYVVSVVTPGIDGGSSHINCGFNTLDEAIQEAVSMVKFSTVCITWVSPKGAVELGSLWKWVKNIDWQVDDIRKVDKERQEQFFS